MVQNADGDDQVGGFGFERFERTTIDLRSERPERLSPGVVRASDYHCASNSFAKEAQAIDAVVECPLPKELVSAHPLCANALRFQSPGVENGESHGALVRKGLARNKRP